MGEEATDIYLKLSGEDVSPETVRWETMYRIFGGLESAVEAMAFEVGLEIGEDEALIIPETIERSSFGLSGRINERVRKPLRQLGGAFGAGAVDELPAPVRDSLRDVQGALGDRGANLEVTSDAGTFEGFTLTEDRPVIPEPQSEVQERTSQGVVYGICMRVNRTRKDATVVLQDGSKCRVEPLDDAQIQTLMTGTGADLGQVFRIEGEATWNVDDYRITAIKPVSIDAVERDAGKFFDELRDATDGAFDDTDPVDYVRKLRGE